jgi:hypothetical protein
MSFWISLLPFYREDSGLSSLLHNSSHSFHPLVSVRYLARLAKLVVMGQAIKPSGKVQTSLSHAHTNIFIYILGNPELYYNQN